MVMLKASNPRRKETLAEYYFRTNRHLLGDIKMCEFDTPRVHYRWWVKTNYAVAAMRDKERTD